MGMPTVKRGPSIRALLAGVLVLVLISVLWFSRGRGPVAPVANPFKRCPVADGIVKDNFGAPRSDHTHLGDDIVADMGAPVLATFGGTIRNTRSAGGLIVRLDAPDGSFTIGKHLSATTEERSVQAGAVIGYVGRLDVPGDLPHLHFEWHPDGGQAVDPFPYLSQVCPKTVPVGTGSTGPSL